MSRDEGVNRAGDRRRGSFVAAFLFLALAVLWSPWGVDRLIGATHLDEPGLREVFLGIAGVLAAWAIVSAVAPRSRTLARVHALVIVVAVLFPLCAEAAFRIAIANGHEKLRKPDAYADSLSSEEYWRLWFTWSEGTPEGFEANLDARLGWRRPKTPQNPLGAIAEGSVPVDFDGPAVLFYGDSFVEGMTEVDKKLPQVLEKRLYELPVYNLGGGGYGVGQIWMRFEENLDRFERPITIVGVMSRDLDRTVLGVRGYRKPSFALDASGAITVQDLPVPVELDAWRRAHRPGIVSYFLSFVVQLVHVNAASGNWVESEHRKAEKIAVNHAILESIIRQADESGQRLVFVLFVTPDVIGRPGWRETFLREFFAESGVPWIDTEEVLVRCASEEGLATQRFFRADNHLNAGAHERVADAIADELLEAGFVDRVRADARRKNRARTK